MLLSALVDDLHLPAREQADRGGAPGCVQPQGLVEAAVETMRIQAQVKDVILGDFAGPSSLEIASARAPICWTKRSNSRSYRPWHHPHERVHHDHFRHIWLPGRRDDRLDVLDRKNDLWFRVHLMCELRPSIATDSEGQEPIGLAERELAAGEWYPEELSIAWWVASREADAAYAAWKARPDRDCYAAYVAATDQSRFAEGQAFLVIATRGPRPIGYAMVLIRTGPDDTWPIGERYGELHSLSAAPPSGAAGSAARCLRPSSASSPGAGSSISRSP